MIRYRPVEIRLSGGHLLIIQDTKKAIAIECGCTILANYSRSEIQDYL